MSKEEALAYSQKLTQPVFQPFIEGKEWSVDVYRSEKGAIKGCVARSRDQVVQGESQITTTVSYPALQRLGEEASHQLDIEATLSCKRWKTKKAVFI